ncbi:hypothetical protein F444_02847 [Phytophthora nicotianae P1976]|uniref:Uncharacterized protein n=1 Tax=Phytophthora nicotianae P1976 TaxID=1317066 RepID=A0A081AW09_PHYNI|nr:hypothetical protein F444_02847 [Phytophthora nicotianae P1976]
MWDCPCAQASWQKLISHWTGEQWSLQTTERFQEACASRKAPALSRFIKAQLGRDHPDEETQYVKEWKRMWRIMCSICMTSLWIQRNRVVFQQEEITIDNFWDVGSGGDQVGKYKTMAKEKGVSVKDVLLEMVGPDKKCGFTTTDVGPQPVPADGKAK